MTEQLTREQVLELKPCRKNNIFIHMVVMGNKAWKYRQGMAGDYYTRVVFSPDKPKMRNTDVEEISFDELDYHRMVISDVPDYFGSISAAMDTEEKVMQEDAEGYATALTTVLGIDTWNITTNAILKIAHATALDRSKASLLAVMGL